MTCGTTPVGAWPTEGYEFDDSTAIVNDQFVGLALDEENQADKMEQRIQDWLKQLEDKWQ